MNKENNWQLLSKLCFGTAVFSEQVLHWIAENNLWNIWVPKNYGGLELSFSEGLAKLQELAKIDGSLGWTLTLCSGANYFIGNLQPETAKEIFKNPETTVMGGSGGVSGKAEKLGDNYKINGTWHYATGAPYLSHFTLNAEIFENGSVLVGENGSPKVRSFVLPREKVTVIENWNTMGLKASATHSFQVENALVPERYSFIYNKFYLPQHIFKIPFSVFADLTLWVNYVGMAQHFLEEARAVTSADALQTLEESMAVCNQNIALFAEAIEGRIAAQKNIGDNFIKEIHTSASNSVKNISRNIIELYPYLGVKASRENHTLHLVFCDYFTATQHHIFTK